MVSRQCVFPPLDSETRTETSSFVGRLCKDVVAPLGTPITGADGRLMKEIFVPKGTITFLGLLAMNVSPAIWGPDAGEWKPERWLAPPPQSLVNARIPGVYSSMCVLCCLAQCVSLDVDFVLV